MHGPFAARRGETSPMRRAVSRGFTLIELMIVVAIIAIVAAIAVPNLVAARLRANESATISVLRNVATSQAQFRQAARADEDLDNTGEYGTFGELTGSFAVRGSSMVSVQLTRSMSLVDANGEVQRNGYFYRMYLPGPGGVGVRERAGGGLDTGVLDPDEAEIRWLLYAWPAKYDSSGNRTFFMSYRSDLLASDAPAYERGNCTAILPGSALLTADTSTCTDLPAVNATGADGNNWRQVQ